MDKEFEVKVTVLRNGVVLTDIQDLKNQSRQVPTVAALGALDCAKDTIIGWQKKDYRPIEPIIKEK